VRITEKIAQPFIFMTSGRFVLMNSFVAMLYRWSHRIFRVAHGGTQSIFEGVWMGLLPESALDAISEESYADGGRYTATAYVDQGFHFWEKLAIDKYFAAGSRVLVGAAGGGREIIALARAGFQVEGFECSRRMVEAGEEALRSRKIAATLTQASPCVAPEIGGLFDAAIVGWNGYSYISPRKRRVEFMKGIRAQLRSGSPVLISIAVRASQGGTLTWTPRIANLLRVCTLRRPVFEIGDSFSHRPKMHFTQRQIEQELRDAGFSVITFYSWGNYGAVVAKS
jgi:hypothetical protein